MGQVDIANVEFFRRIRIRAIVFLYIVAAGIGYFLADMLWYWEIGFYPGIGYDIIILALLLAGWNYLRKLIFDSEQRIHDILESNFNAGKRS